MKFLNFSLFFLFTILILLLPFGQLTRISINPQVRVYLHDFLVAAIILVFFFKKIIYKEKVSIPKLGHYIFGFFCFACFSLFLAAFCYQTKELLTASLYLLRWSAYAGLYFVLVDLKKKLKFKKRLLRLLLFSGFLSVCFGWGQYIFFPDIRPLAPSGWDPHYYRVVGTFFDPSFAGITYVLVMILMVSLFWRKLKKFSFKNLAVYYLPLATCYFAFAYTYSRSSYLSCLVAVGYLSKVLKSKKFFIFYCLFFTLTLLLLNQPGRKRVRLERAETAFSRIKNWSQSLKIAFDYPLFGVGFNTYRYVQRDYGFLRQGWQESHAGAGSDSSLLFVLATTGVAGFIVYLRLLKKIFSSSFVVVASISAVLVHSFFNNSLFYPWVMIWLWILFGLEEFRVRK